MQYTVINTTTCCKFIVFSCHIFCQVSQARNCFRLTEICVAFKSVKINHSCCISKGYVVKVAIRTNNVPTLFRALFSEW